MKSRLTLLIISLLIIPLQLFAQGLKIKGNDYFIDERTSYVVFENIPPVFKERLVLDFEISLMNLHEAYSIGYILRIKDEDINTTYNILYNDQGRETVFKFNHEGRDVLITATFDKDKLYENQWVTMHIDFNLVDDSVKLRINGEEFSAGGLGLQDGWRPWIHFGRSEHVIDVPTFCLRNLTVGNKEKQYRFPLNESEGNAVHDSHKKVIGQVDNPVWLINDAYYWKAAGVNLSSRTVAGSNIDLDTQEIYYFNEDSIVFYNTRTKETHSHKYANNCPMYFRLGTNFIDRKTKRLYVYEVSDLPRGDVSMAYLDMETFAWTVVTKEVLPTQLHHHSCFFDEANRRYIIFGGFGNSFYNKNFYSFDLETHKWETLTFTGDAVTPRYFSSMGYHEAENALYLFGGMGNESGDQTVGRVYYYELYKIDLNEDRITRLWEIPWEKENVVPVRGMVLADDYSFYTLCYPEHFSKSVLKLYRFSIEDGSHEILGDSIAIVSEKITTNANLYCNKRSGELYTVIQEFDYDDIASTVKIYSLSYPPVAMDGLTFYSKANRGKTLWIILTVLFLAILGSFLYSMWRLGRKDMKENSVEDTGLPETNELPVLTFNTENEERANAIYLFGDFSIRDRNNRDITYMLSTKLRQAFFLILQYSLKNGITTQELSDLLWPGRPEDKVKNSRGVTLNNLRKILGDLDGIKLIHEKGCYKIVISNECYCDYIKCLEIIEALDPVDIEQLVTITGRGKFLKSVDIPLLDSFKEYIERRLEPVLYVDAEKAFSTANYPASISLCESLFYIDPLNEEALYFLLNSMMKLKMADEARRRYLLFVAEYKSTMNEEYPKSFIDLTE